MFLTSSRHPSVVRVAVSSHCLGYLHHLVTDRQIDRQIFLLVVLQKEFFINSMLWTWSIYTTWRKRIFSRDQNDWINYIRTTTPSFQIQTLRNSCVLNSHQDYAKTCITLSVKLVQLEKEDFISGNVELFYFSFSPTNFCVSVFHGFGGRLAVTDIDLSPVTKIMTMAYSELGIKKRDVNGRSQYGMLHSS